MIQRGSSDLLYYLLKVHLPLLVKFLQYADSCLSNSALFDRARYPRYLHQIEFMKLVQFCGYLIVIFCKVTAQNKLYIAKIIFSDNTVQGDLSKFNGHTRRPHLSMQLK